MKANNKQQQLYAAAQAACAQAYAPYSNFAVGAAVLAHDGQIYAGANVENIAYPQGWCAETSALAQMLSHGQRRLLAVAVYAESEQLIVPCGGCRQRLSEFAGAEALIYSCGAEGIRRQFTLAELLPHGFASLKLTN